MGGATAAQVTISVLVLSSFLGVAEISLRTPCCQWRLKPHLTFHKSHKDLFKKGSWLFLRGSFNESTCSEQEKQQHVI